MMADEVEICDDVIDMEVDEQSKCGEVRKSRDPGSEEYDYSDVPKSLVATNVADIIFDDSSTKKWFESLCQHFDEDCTFHYFRNFHRIRINFQTGEGALGARIALHQRQIAGSEVGFYFVQPVKVTGSGSNTLEPPEPDKQFLLSPPASPPVGWEPAQEAEPVINYDLLSALSNLTPGESRELHPPEGSKPGIVVHTCEDIPRTGSKLQIIQTKRPSQSCDQ